MKFSILITSYNKGRYLEECIKSCLSQTNKNFEIIICDNYSTDNSDQIFGWNCHSNNYHKLLFQNFY